MGNAGERPRISVADARTTIERALERGSLFEKSLQCSALGQQIGRNLPRNPGQRSSALSRPSSSASICAAIGDVVENCCSPSRCVMSSRKVRVA